MKVVVVSPHIDDAVMSLGASINRLTSIGRSVTILNVFAGDPSRATGASHWDSKRGVDTASEATVQRRMEDARAAALLRAKTVWLPFDDSGYVARRDPDRIWTLMERELAGADAVLVPGYPLSQHDHRWSSALVAERHSGSPVVLYGELPYSAQPHVVAKTLLRGRSTGLSRHIFSNEFAWRTTHIEKSDLRAKAAAVACYGGELHALGFRGRFSGAFDRLFGREHLGIPETVVTAIEALEPLL